VYVVIANPGYVPPPPHPPLSTAYNKAANTLTISWPTTFGNSWTLISTSNPKALESTWGNVTPQPAITQVGGNYTMTVTLPAGTSGDQFYALSAP
jgi:hypothetical protein